MGTFRKLACSLLHPQEEAILLVQGGQGQETDWILEHTYVYFYWELFTITSHTFQEDSTGDIQVN